jgi:formate hydrogenlyase subunit 6/NADH:ubiquinone oxidoreductase subunit I
MEKGNTASDQAYMRIAENIDRGFQTAPKGDGGISKAFLGFLKIVYSPQEAELVQHLDMYLPKTAEELATITGKDGEVIQETLHALIRRAALAGSKDKYRLPVMPSLLNLHMFYPDIKPDDLEAARLYQQFFIKERYYKYYATSGKGTPGLRAIPVEKAIHQETKTLDAEEAHAYVKGLGTEDLALVPCPCRTRTEKLGIRECKDKFPIGACIFIGRTATHFQDIGLGKKVTKEKAIEYLDQMVDFGLIPTTDNYIDDPHMIICLCCGCCCSNVRGRTRWDNPTAVLPASFLPQANDDCVGCGECVDRCMLDALSLDEDEGRPIVDPEKCIGCGVCAVGCPEEALKLHRHERTPPFQTAMDLYGTMAKDNDRA